MVQYTIVGVPELTPAITDLINSKIIKGYNVTFINMEDYCRSGFLNLENGKIVFNSSNFDWYNDISNREKQVWSIRNSDKHIVLDLDGDGRDEIVLVNDDKI